MIKIELPKNLHEGEKQIKALKYQIPRDISLKDKHIHEIALEKLIEHS